MHLYLLFVPFSGFPHSYDIGCICSDRSFCLPSPVLLVQILFPLHKEFETRGAGALGDDAFGDVFFLRARRCWRSDLATYCIRGLRCGVSVRLVINGSNIELLWIT